MIFIKKVKSDKEIELIDVFSIQLSQLVHDKKHQYPFPTFESEMYEKIGICKTSLQNYRKKYENGGKLPRYDELIRIHDYFCVSYSYLFGESSIKSSKDDNIDIGIKLGLDDEALTILKDLKKKSNSETLDDNFEAQIKLFLINSFIKDNKLLESLLAYFPVVLGRNILDKKCNGNPAYHSFATENSIYEMTKYAIISKAIKSLDKLAKEENVPLLIARNCEEYALKYAGAMQAEIKKILSSKNK